jgi:acyl carrier protein
MKRDEIFTKLNGVFRDVFDDPSLTVNDGTTAADIVEWDSQMHISLLVSIESEFGFTFNMGEVMGIKNVGALADIIAERVKA